MKTSFLVLVAICLTTPALAKPTNRTIASKILASSVLVSCQPIEKARGGSGPWGIELLEGPSRFVLDGNSPGESKEPLEIVVDSTVGMANYKGRDDVSVQRCPRQLIVGAGFLYPISVVGPNGCVYSASVNAEFGGSWSYPKDILCTPK